MSTAMTAHPASPADVVALQYSNPRRMIGVPLSIITAVVLITVAISVAILRAGGNLHGQNFNAGVVWGVLGYSVAIGVQNVSASFPFALALGSTRRTFVLGDLLTSVVQALIVALAAVVLLVLELVTDGWFIGAKVLSTTILGDGNPALLGGAMFLAVLTSLSVGSAFGAAWTRFGPRGPALISLSLAVVGVLVLLLLLPQADAIGAAARPWWLAIGGAVVIGLSIVGQYVLLRRASVR
jgi:hypothetical protein